MNIKDYAGVEEKKKTEDARHHIRLNPKYCAKITSPRMDLILSAAKLQGVSLSEFCKVAALKEARFAVLKYREDRIEVAKKILEGEEMRRLKEMAK